MRQARNLERRLEALVEGLVGRVFRGQLHPLELGTRLVREADLAAFEADAGPTVPNAYLLRLNPRDLGEAPDSAPVSNELAELLTAAAVDRGWRMEGPVEVVIKEDGRVPAGTIECQGKVRPGRLAPWGYLHQLRGGRQLPLSYNRTLIGRSGSMDLPLTDPEISRRHALLWREGDDVWVSDLGSSNGTAVDGAPANGPASVYPGSVVSFGSAQFTYRPA